MEFLQTYSIKYSYLPKQNYSIKQNPLHNRWISANTQPSSGRKGDHEVGEGARGASG